MVNRFSFHVGVYVWCGVMMPGQRVDRTEIWEAWVMEQADSKEILNKMNRASQDTRNENLKRWKGEQESDSSEEDESMQEIRTTVRASQLKVERKRFAKRRRRHSKNKLCKLLQMPIHRQCWQVKGKMTRLIVRGSSFRDQTSAVFCALRDGATA